MMEDEGESFYSFAGVSSYRDRRRFFGSWQSGYG